MLFSYEYVQIMLLVLSYMIIYNLTSFVIFFTLLQIVGSNLKTVYSFANLGSPNIFTKILGISILSLAGVPPLLGFFSKVFIFVLISNSNFLTLYPPFFTLLFISLYFYVQNLRFLNSTNKTSLILPNEISPRLNILYFTFITPTIVLSVLGFCFTDDLFIITAWLLL